MTWPEGLQPARPERPCGTEPRSWKFGFDSGNLPWKAASAWSRLDIADKLAITCFCASLFGALAGVAIALAVVN